MPVPSIHALDVRNVDMQGLHVGTCVCVCVRVCLFVCVCESACACVCLCVCVCCVLGRLVDEAAAVCYVVYATMYDRHHHVPSLHCLHHQASKQISNLLKNLVEANAMENFRLAELAKNQTEAAKVHTAQYFSIASALCAGVYYGMLLCRVAVWYGSVWHAMLWQKVFGYTAKPCTQLVQRLGVDNDYLPLPLSLPLRVATQLAWVCGTLNGITCFCVICSALLKALEEDGEPIEEVEEEEVAAKDEL